MALQDLESAVNCLRRCTTAHARHAPAFLALGTALAAQFRDQEAIAALQRCVELDPQCHESYVHWGSLLMRNGQCAGAARCFIICTAACPERADVFAMLGSAQSQAGDAAAAIDSYRRALALDASNAAALKGLAELLLLQGSEEEARDLFSQLARLEGNKQ